MKPARVWIVWLALAVCAALVVAAMLWLTRGVLAAERDRLHAERDRTAAEARADLEERTRLALWRMDALGAAIMLRENRYPANQRDGRTANHVITKSEPEILLHFEINKGGEPTSPELNVANPAATVIAERLRRLRELLAANPLPGDEWAQLERAANEGQLSWDAVPKDAPLEQGYNTVQRLNKSGDELRKQETYQTNSNTNERFQRAKAVAQTVDSAVASQGMDADAPVLSQLASAAAAPPRQVSSTTASIPPVMEVGQMRGVWVGGELFLLRQVAWSTPEPSPPPTRQIESSGHAKHTAVQGVWLDSQLLRNQLLREVADLLPLARLVPAVGERATENPLAMVSFPFRLERHEILTTAALPLPPPFGLPLLVAWAAVTLAVVTTSLLVRGVMRLSERRASFVSAVTHELRTPLTTFRLYSDMLESGAVKEDKRGQYLRVLSREADRLSHLVENVLAFSRIERGNARSNKREIATGELLENSRERLEARLASAGLSLTMATTSVLRVRVDTAAVDHILFNLIDNAAKYASNSNPPVVTISVHGTGRSVDITVSDHGPGIQPSERTRIFRAFHKSAREAAESQPGVGLGLALSRRLARAQGGNLLCTTSTNGACFILRLPAA